MRMAGIPLLPKVCKVFEEETLGLDLRLRRHLLEFGSTWFEGVALSSGADMFLAGEIASAR
jgi:hypothetical protein